MDRWLAEQYFGNPLSKYLFDLFLLILTVGLVRSLKPLFIKKLKRSLEGKAVVGDLHFVKELVNFIVFLIFLGLANVVIDQLDAPKIETVAAKGLLLLFVLQTTRFVLRWTKEYMITVLLPQYAPMENSALSKTLLRIAEAVIWGVVILFLLNNLGFNIWAVLTGLGIGGIAIALATQTILGDLFNYFVIYLDRPFEIGDFIHIGETKGKVVDVGVKTTRLLALTGEEVVLPNSMMTSNKLQNFSRLKEKRVVLMLGIVYETSLVKLQMIPNLTKAAIEMVEGVRFDRSCWIEYGDSSLNFEVVYYILSDSSAFHAEAQQKVNLKIFESLGANSIDMAYPTQRVLLEQHPA